MRNLDLLDPTDDYIFKRVFGDEKHKPVLLSLLNSILRGNPHVSDLQLRNCEIPKFFEKGKTVRLDIKAEINPQEFVDIEMQVNNTGEILERAIQYLQNMSADNFRKLSENERNDSTSSYKLPKVIGIWILKNNIFRDREDPFTELGWSIKGEPGFVTDKERLFTIELPKYKAKNEKEQDMLDRWMSFFTNPRESEKVEIPEIQEALDTLDWISGDDDFKMSYTSYCESLFETRHQMAYAENMAKQAGREEGKKEEKFEIAKNMLQENVDISIIFKVTGLSVDEIEKLK